MQANGAQSETQMVVYNFLNCIAVYYISSASLLHSSAGRANGAASMVFFSVQNMATKLFII